MKWILILLICCCSCLTTTTITCHSEQSTIIENGDNIYVVPENTPCVINLKQGVLEVKSK